MKDKITADRLLTFKRGHDVGYFGQQLFPGGTDVSKITSSAGEAVLKTAELLAAGTQVIYEAAFVHRGVLIMTDILCCRDGVCNAYEIKSSLKVSEAYLKDAYLQYYVLRNSLPGFAELFLVTLNPEYVLNGEPDVKKLFRRRAVAATALENFPYIEFQIEAANRVLEENAIPNIPIGRQCFKPYQCDYFSICWKDTMSDTSVFNLPLADKGTLFEWHEAGMKNIDQVPDEIIRKDALVKIKNAFILNEPIINYQRIDAFIARITGPVAAMDMEVWSPALPQIQGTSPFEQIPFLVSFYDGTNYSYYFTDGGGDEREEFAEQLISLAAGFSTILVYDRNLEVNVIGRLAAMFPHLAAGLAEVRNRLVDVFEIFLKLDYYHPGFKNNFSLKAVASALLPDVAYSAISSGIEAMSWYEQYRASANPIEREYFKGELVNYCNTDTQATMGLYGFLKMKSED